MTPELRGNNNLVALIASINNADDLLVIGTMQSTASLRPAPAQERQLVVREHRNCLLEEWVSQRTNASVRR